MSIETLSRPGNTKRVEIAPIIIKGPSKKGSFGGFDVRKLEPFTPRIPSEKKGAVKNFTFDTFKPFPEVKKNPPRVEKPERKVNLPPKKFVFATGVSAKGERPVPTRSRSVMPPTQIDNAPFYTKKNTSPFGKFDSSLTVSLKPKEEVKRDIVKSDTKAKEIFVRSPKPFRLERVDPSTITPAKEKRRYRFMQNPQPKREKTDYSRKTFEKPPKNIVLGKLQPLPMPKQEEVKLAMLNTGERRQEVIIPEKNKSSQIEVKSYRQKEQRAKQIEADVQQAVRVVEAYKKLLPPEEWAAKKEELATKTVRDVVEKTTKVAVKEPIEWYCLTFGFPIKNVITPFSIKFPELGAWGEEILYGMKTKVEFDQIAIEAKSSESKSGSGNKREIAIGVEKESRPMICFVESLWSLWSLARLNTDLQGETIVGRYVTPGKEKEGSVAVVGVVTKKEGKDTVAFNEKQNAEICPLCLNIFQGLNLSPDTSRTKDTKPQE